MKLILSLLGMLSIATFLAAGMGCSKKVSATPSTTTPTSTPTVPPVATTNPLTIAEVTGSHLAPCYEIIDNSYGNTFGNSPPGNYYFTRYIYLASNSTYNLDVKFYYGTNCTGGTELFEYIQYGSYTLGQVNAAGATEISYTTQSSTSGILDVKGGAVGTPPTSGVQNASVQALNQACFGGSASSPMTPTAADSLEYVEGQTCNQGSQGINLPTFPGDSATFYDIIQLDSVTAPTEFVTSQGTSIFNMGNSSSYPTGAATFSYAF